MFTGIVEEIGTVEHVTLRSGVARLRVRCRRVLDDLSPGDSVSVNGVCLTVSSLGDGRFECDLSRETLSRTTLGRQRPGARVNLERALRVGERMGGHYVNGHVDCVGTVRSVRRAGQGVEMEVALAAKMMRYVVEKGCVAVDGVSLTPFDVTDTSFRVALIPETLARTTLGERRPGDKVNVELDLMLKHLERTKALEGSEKGIGLTLEKLVQSGFVE